MPAALNAMPPLAMPPLAMPIPSSHDEPPYHFTVRLAGTGVKVCVSTRLLRGTCANNRTMRGADTERWRAPGPGDPICLTWRTEQRWLAATTSRMRTYGTRWRSLHCSPSSRLAVPMTAGPEVSSRWMAQMGRPRAIRAQKQGPHGQAMQAPRRAGAPVRWEMRRVRPR
jgi:hypothetical protein